MALIGNLIKGVIGLSGNLPLIEKSAQDAQSEALIFLLSQAKNTAFGKFYDFAGILESKNPSKEYGKRVPIHTYQNINERWWKQQQKFEDITWPGKPDFFALSSGTTGKKSKRIPVSKEMVTNTRAVGIGLLRDLNNFNLPTEVFESEILMLGSSSNLLKNKNGFLEGEISGINTYSFPDWYDWFYRPGKEIAKIDDWDERLDNIVKEAPSWNIGAIAGIPSWVLLMLKAVIKEYKLKHINELWPNLTVYNTGGVAFEPFRTAFDEITNQPLIVIDTYLASEGFFGYTSQPNTMQMKLVMDTNIYYEFIPFNEEGFDENGNLLKNPRSLTINNILENKEYALIISTCSGAWRYMIGDTIKFSNLEQRQFTITGRTKFFLNVVGSQLTEEKLNKAVTCVAKKYNTSIEAFSVACLENKNEEYYHQWIIVCNEEIPENQLENEIDLFLKETNKNYRVARTKALKYVKIKRIETKKWYDILTKITNKKGGQLKTPKVVKAKKMRRLLDILASDL